MVSELVKHWPLRRATRAIFKTFEQVGHAVATKPLVLGKGYLSV